MGCCCLKTQKDAEKQGLKTAKNSAPHIQIEATSYGKTSWESAGAGQKLGGSVAESEDGLTRTLSAEERRQQVLEAADRRQNNAPGLSAGKAAEMRERQE